MLKLFLKIASRLFAAALLVGLTLAVTYFASARSLPFLTEEGQEFSIIDETSAPPDEKSHETRSENSGENSGEKEPAAEEGADAAAFLAGIDKASPAEIAKSVSEYKFDAATQKVVLYDDISPLGALSPPGIEAFNPLSIRMGYIFAGENIYAQNLSDLTSVLSGYRFTGERDNFGHPVFARGNAYYYVDASAVVQPSYYDPALDNRAFDFDVPVYVGVQDKNIKRVYIKSHRETERYGYYYGDRVFANNCAETFAFANGRGVALRYEGGEKILEIYSDFYYEHGGNLIATGFYPPLTRGLYSAGFFYFDQGFTRVRIKNPNSTYTETLADLNGKLLQMVDDYPLVSYSDGILLVGNGAFYGYMKNNLSWITNPVFTYAEPFLEGLAVVGLSDGKFGLVDTEGNYVLKPVFDHVTRCSGGIFAAYSKTSGWSLFAKVYK